MAKRAYRELTSDMSKDLFLDDELYSLQQVYLNLVNKRLPAQARAHNTKLKSVERDNKQLSTDTSVARGLIKNWISEPAEKIFSAGAAKALPDSALNYPIHLNHCFGRVILDTLFEDCWYKHLSKRCPAYKQLDKHLLNRAIEIGEVMLASAAVTQVLNARSLNYRGKLKENY